MIVHKQIHRTFHVGLTALGVILIAACSPAPTAETAKAPEQPDPQPVNGWIERPLAKNTIQTHTTPWRTDTINVLIFGEGGEIEYKLNANAGDSFVYTVTYENLSDNNQLDVEFHGHTEKDENGIGDLMFYSVTKGITETGQFTAPFDGNHGWYWKNTSPNDIKATIQLAGFYELVGEIQIGED